MKITAKEATKARIEIKMKLNEWEFMQIQFALQECLNENVSKDDIKTIRKMQKLLNKMNEVPIIAAINVNNFL